MVLNVWGVHMYPLGFTCNPEIQSSCIWINSFAINREMDSWVTHEKPLAAALCIHDLEDVSRQI